MRKLKIDYKEIAIWGILYLLLGIFVSFTKEHPHFHFDEMLFLLAYLIASIFISYSLIPNYLYKKRIPAFILSVIGVLIFVILFEELVLEPIFYKGRASVFNFFPTLIDILPPILLFTGVKFARDAYEKQHNLEKMNRIAVENELQYLNSQISPHFLFNNLNNIYALSLEQSPQTPDTILHLSSILRYMLYDCRQKAVLLSSEIDHLSQFVELYRIQLGQKAQINMTVDVKDENRHIAPLLLIVFVENAFKHSQSSQTENIIINIHLSENDGQLQFTCENTFMEQTNTENLAKGIGLDNVKTRLRLLYPEKHTLHISSSNERYKVSLKISI